MSWDYFFLVNIAWGSHTGSSARDKHGAMDLHPGTGMKAAEKKEWKKP